MSQHPGLAEVAAAAGSITLVHCEDAHLLEQAGRAALAGERMRVVAAGT